MKKMDNANTTSIQIFLNKRKTLDNFIKQYFILTVIDDEAKEFMLYMDEKDWEDVLTFGNCYMNRGNYTTMGLYDIFITLLLCDHLYSKYKQLIPSTFIESNWCESLLVRRVVNNSQNLSRLLTPSQIEMVITYITGNMLLLNIPTKIKYKYVSPLSQLCESLDILCERIAWLISRDNEPGKQDCCTTVNLLSILNNLKRK